VTTKRHGAAHLFAMKLRRNTAIDNAKLTLIALIAVLSIAPLTAAPPKDCRVERFATRRAS
jgi:hypothetical protein